jgi:hypothetical protein
MTSNQLDQLRERVTVCHNGALQVTSRCGRFARPEVSAGTAPRARCTGRGFNPSGESENRRLAQLMVAEPLLPTGPQQDSMLSRSIGPCLRR